jgi:triosephosphate isomerase
MSGRKIAKALIGGNWKCNGTTSSIKQMAEVLNKAGSFSSNSEVRWTIGTIVVGMIRLFTFRILLFR